MSRTFHAWLDYMSCTVLILAPWIFKFSNVDIAMAVSIGAGLLIFFSSLTTKYEGGIFKIIPMSMHLNLDILLGVFLLASPWIFSFRDTIIWPHLAFGALTILSGFLTVRQSIGQPSTGEYI